MFENTFCNSIKSHVSHKIQKSLQSAGQRSFYQVSLRGKKKSIDDYNKTSALNLLLQFDLIQMQNDKWQREIMDKEVNLYNISLSSTPKCKLLQSVYTFH